MSEDLTPRISAAVKAAERRSGGKANHVHVRRDGSIVVGTSREDLAPALKRAFGSATPPANPEIEDIIQRTLI